MRTHVLHSREQLRMAGALWAVNISQCQHDSYEFSFVLNVHYSKSLAKLERLQRCSLILSGLVFTSASKLLLPSHPLCDWSRLSLAQPPLSDGGHSIFHSQSICVLFFMCGTCCFCLDFLSFFFFLYYCQTRLIVLEAEEAPAM